jgi:hypothetical protein
MRVEDFEYNLYHNCPHKLYNMSRQQRNKHRNKHRNRQFRTHNEITTIVMAPTFGSYATGVWSSTKDYQEWCKMSK